MMAFLGQWFGFDTTVNAHQDKSRQSRAQPGVVISSSKNAKKPIPPPPPPLGSASDASSLRKTKSDELLRDFEVMRFLSRVDEHLKLHNSALSRADLERLQTLHAQAVADNCGLLTDIIEHFEIEHAKLCFHMSSAGPSSAATESSSARRNQLVF